MCFGKSDIYNHVITGPGITPPAPKPDAPVKKPAEQALAEKANAAAKAVMVAVQASQLNAATGGPAKEVLTHV